MFRILALCALFLVLNTAVAQNAARGQRIAGQVCAACHAADGNSVAPANPKIAGQFSEYLHKQLVDFRGQGGKKPVRESPIMKKVSVTFTACPRNPTPRKFSSSFIIMPGTSMIPPAGKFEGTRNMIVKT